MSVRQKGGTLPTSWAKLYCVISRNEIKYYGSVSSPSAALTVRERRRQETYNSLTKATIVRNCSNLNKRPYVGNKDEGHQNPTYGTD